MLRQLLSGDDLAGALNQDGEKFGRLRLEFDGRAILQKLKRAEIE